MGGSAVTHITWEKFEGGPVEYGVTGTKRLTYWLRLNGDVRKITSATPSAFDAMAGAHYHKTRARAYEGFSYGYKALGEVT